MLMVVAVIGAMLYRMPASKYDDVSSYAQYDAVVEIYCRRTTLSSVDMGLGRKVTCSVDDFAQAFAQCTNVDGLSVRFNGDVWDVDDIVNRLQAKVVSSQQLDDLLVICCVSPRLQGGVNIDGNRVNVQIALSDGTVTVGYPLILGSY